LGFGELADERQILDRMGSVDATTVEPVLRRRRFGEHACGGGPDLYVDSKIKHYIVTIVRMTVNRASGGWTLLPDSSWASPRAVVALLRAGKAHADLTRLITSHRKILRFALLTFYAIV